MAEPNDTILAVTLKAIQDQFPGNANITDKTTLSSLGLKTAAEKATLVGPIVSALKKKGFGTDALSPGAFDNAKTVGDILDIVLTAVLSSHLDAVRFHMRELKKHLSKLHP